jgi:simple sugar transport system ATP-binding protein
LIGALSVAENLLLGRPEAAGRLISPRRLAAGAQALAHRHGLAIGDPTRPCVALPVGTQARVEILRALSGGPKILLLDEPTAVLTPPEIAELFATLRRLRAAGLLVMFITHKLDEALALCDTVSVLRGGRLVTTVAAGGLSAARLAGMMVGVSTDAASPVAPPSAEALPGAPAAPTASATPLPTNETATAAGATPATPAVAAALASAPAPAVLAVRNLTTAAEDGRVALQGIDFTLASGEICGIAGVDGNGQDELADALSGLLDRQGTVTVAGARLTPGDVAAAQRAGMALIPGDRRRDGLALGLAVWENVLLSAPLLRRFTRHGILDVASAHRFAGELAREYRVTLTDVAQPIAGLSGGNQQRIVIGRALALHPRVLIAVNPTRGLDIAATMQAHATLARAARTGAAVLLISTDLDELAALSARLFALYRGRLAGPVAPDDRERLGALMTGLAA